MTMLGVAKNRLAEERKSWRKDHPFGFVAKPSQGAGGEVNMMQWKCVVPGKKGTDWEGGRYPVTLTFSSDYPTKPPMAEFPPRFFHPNVYPSGKVCLSIINDPGTWKPSITIKAILTGIQDLLDTPNNSDAAQEDAFYCYDRSPAEYKRRVRQQAQKYSDDDEIVL
mmetsp:Transcript_16847/g.43690  ORF Transcript_16847/g.43690 Transcript_16847/m.43690 type:complete len:166 (-) Transcript_16847:135-632(-)